MAFTCPNCKAETNKLIAPPGSEGKRNKAEGTEGGKLFCPGCYTMHKYSNTNLHQIVDKFEHSKTGKVRRITHGKAWEIENRTISKDDPKVVINRVTGREAQY